MPKIPKEKPKCLKDGRDETRIFIKIDIYVCFVII